MLPLDCHIPHGNVVTDVGHKQLVCNLIVSISTVFGAIEKSTVCGLAKYLHTELSQQYN